MKIKENTRKIKMTIATMVVVLFMSTGCATIASLGKDVCDTILGGSKVGALCEKLEGFIVEDDNADVEENAE